MYIACH